MTPTLYDSNDLIFSNDGDIVVDSGDLLSTSFDPLLAVIQQVRIRIHYMAGSWRLNPNLGVVDMPIGQINSLETAKGWESLVYAALVHDGLILPEDLEIETAPLSEDTILTMVTVQAQTGPSSGGNGGFTVYSVQDFRHQYHYTY